MKNSYRRYVVGSFMALSQFLLFWQTAMILRADREVTMVAYLIFVFLYLKENIYSFETCLIWEELKKQMKCLAEYIVVTGIIVLVFLGPKELLRYEVLGILGFVYSFVLAKAIRIMLFGFLKKNLLIVGVGETASEMHHIIKSNGFAMYNFLGFVDSGKNENIAVDEDMIVGDSVSAINYIENNSVQEVIVALPKITAKELNEVIDGFEKFVKNIKIIPKVHKMYTFAPKVQDYDGVMLVATKNNMMSLKRRMLKRGLDIVGGIAGMLLLLPLYLKYGREIKKDGGPALFTHTRIGRDLKPLKMYKFRSMYIDAEARLEKMLAEDEAVREEFYTNFKLKNDPRITPAGAFLRRTSLDEFPQFINVIKGEMSLVGPRPVVQKEVEMYYGTEMGQKIFQVKPGITGMWQANGRSDVEDYDERIALDLYYIRNWSLWLDIVILIKTVKNVLGKKGGVLMEPLVSIITPSYNSKDFIGETIESVLNQTYKNWEMIIVDDCSKDLTQEYLKKFQDIDSRIKVLYLEKNVGAGVARNLAIKEAKGKYIAFLDSDDLWNSEKLVKQVEFMQKIDMISLLQSFKKISEDAKEYKMVVNAPRVLTYNKNLYYNHIQTSTVIYNQETLGKIYMPEIRKRQDYGLWQKILEKTNGYGLNESLMLYRLRKNSISANKIELFKWQWKFYREVIKLDVIRALFYLFSCITIKVLGIR